MTKPSSEGMKQRLEGVLIRPEATLAEAVSILYRSPLGILLLCDGEGVLKFTLTDGDVRRAILRGIPFEVPCHTIANQSPVTAPEGVDAREALRLMDRSRDVVLRQLPLVDGRGRVRGLLLREDLLETPEEIPLIAVIMAGGCGRRLRPLTEDLPKPMLPLGDRPLMELTIEQLRSAGIRKINVVTHYLADKIREHFGDGSGFGVEMKYFQEDRPLGTAGALRLMEPPSESVLVINGDILTEVDFRSMLEFHLEHGSELTVAVRKYDFRVPCGVLECSEHRVCGLAEKPNYSFMVNAGIYIPEASAWELMPRRGRFDMTDLIEGMLDEDRNVVSFPVLEYWMDVGQPGDYRQAQDDLKSGEITL